MKNPEENLTRRAFVRRTSTFPVLGTTLGAASLSRLAKADCSGTTVCVYFNKLWRYHDANNNKRIKIKVKYTNRTGAEVTDGGSVEWEGENGFPKTFDLEISSSGTDWKYATLDFEFGSGGDIEIEATAGGKTATDTKTNVTWGFGSDDDNSDGVADPGEWQSV